MSTADILVLVLGVVTLALAGAAVFAFGAKSKSEVSLRAEIDSLRSQLTESAKAVGQIEELNRAIEKQTLSAQELEQQLKSERLEKFDLARELSAAKSDIRNADERLERQTREEREKAQALLESERERREELRRAKDQEIVALKEFVDKANATLGDQFKSISHDTLKEFSTQFKQAAEQVVEQNSETTKRHVELHKEQIAKMLQPVELTLDKLNQQVIETNEKRVHAEALLMSHIQQFAGANEKLASALSKPVMRGSFGQDKLEQLLDAAGLVQGENYDVQVAVKDGDQTRFVDALVHLAQGKKLVIDSKNLLIPFTEYANATDDTRADCLAEFKRQFRSTLRSLSIKDYSRHWDGIDAVIMFLPDEAMYLAAISEERQLIATMFEHRVFTVSPISLLPILKSVAYILGLEKQNRDTQHIVDAGKGLYESLGIILGKLDTLGDRLVNGVKAYNEVIATFEGNVLPKTRQLGQMGVQKGAPHKLPKPIEAPKREFKDRIVKELTADLPLLTLITEEETTL